MSVLPVLSAMEHYGEQSDRKHKGTFNAMQLEVLVEEANKHVVESYSKEMSM